MHRMYRLLFFFSCIVLASCSSAPEGNVKKLNTIANIYPDYTNVTIPVNIAPLNFQVEEEGDAYFVKVIGLKETYSFNSKDGDFRFSEKKWKKLLSENVDKEIRYELFVEKDGVWAQYKSFSNSIVGDKVDSYLYYRLLHPGYIAYNEISIMQRNLESFNERAVVKNTVVDDNCVNCHAFNQNNPKDFMFHMRGSLGGTYIMKDGDLQKFNLKTKEMKNGAVYPRWHPSGKFVAFSSNKVVQRFHAMDEKKVEVTDLNSSLVLYDVDKNEMKQVPIDKQKRFMDTFPEWSPDGKYIYFCRAKQVKGNFDYRDTKYNLCRASFDVETKQFGEAELVFDAETMGKSVSFPRISPDGTSLVFTLHNYGNFSIWHKEADLYSLNLNDLSFDKCEFNSDFTESYHSWSVNGKWLVFSSKRGDGLSARPYISYLDSNGNWQKPFVLPQKNPNFYKAFVKTFNIPEFAQADMNFTPGEMRNVANKKAIQAKWSNN